MLCPCCGIAVLGTGGGHGAGFAVPTRVRHRAGHRRMGGYVVRGVETDRELLSLLESKHRQLARFGLTEAGHPLLESNSQGVD